MTTFNIKRNDTSPIIRRILKDSAGAAIDFTGGTVRFHMNELDGTNVVDSAATANDASAGDVQYAWQAADTANVGLFNIEWEVTYADSSIETFPNDSHETVSIFEDLA